MDLLSPQYDWKSTKLHNTSDPCILCYGNYTLFDKEHEVQAFFSLEHIKIGNASFFSIVMSRVLIKEQVTLFFKVSEKRRWHECIFIMIGEVFVTIRRPIIITLWILIELIHDKLLSCFAIQHCFYMLKKVQCAFSTFSVI